MVSASTASLSTAALTMLLATRNRTPHFLTIAGAIPVIAFPAIKAFIARSISFSRSQGFSSFLGSGERIFCLQRGFRAIRTGEVRALTGWLEVTSLNMF